MRLFLRCLPLLLALIILSAPALASPASQPLDFNLPSLDGKQLRLSDFRGRVVVIEFFATWCRPCKRALPKLNDFAKQFGALGVSAIGYSLDKGGRQVVKPWVARLGLDFPVVLGSVEGARRLGQVEVLPTTIVIDPKGRMVARYEGPVGRAHLLAAVRPYLRQAHAPAPSASKIKRRQPGESRFRDLWVTDNEQVGDQNGIFVHVVADVADLLPYRGLWMQLDLEPEGGGDARRLYLRIDDVSKEYFVMFGRGDQLPPLYASRAYRAQVSLIDHKRQDIEVSQPFLMAARCGAGPPPVRAQLPGQKPIAPEKAPPVRTITPQAAQGRIKAVRIDANEVHDGQVGIMVRMRVDLEDLPTEPGLWLAINLWPEDEAGRGLTGNGEAIQLFHRVDSTFLEDYVLFVRCDQLPQLPPGGIFRSWITVMVGPHKNVVGRSKEFILGRPCQIASNR